MSYPFMLVVGQFNILYNMLGMSFLCRINTYNTELNDLNKFICLRKSEISFERMSVCIFF